MKIYGINYKACQNLFVVYINYNQSKYFFGAYRTHDKAQKIAAKYNGKVIFIH